ncbi:FAS-associated death domain protein [Erinaceus europaeus]|uniref:FAS-associated death domain protein n=1 Tax=Erinaceus europaeus TaxID=9365 RepID=A0A1S3W5Y3_ERIEU|nr:FAS-associated death domain protein [Erinaceus europaeus]
MDPFLVLLHSVSAALASEELTQLKFLCRDRVGKRKLERVQSGLDLFAVLLEQSELDGRRPALLRQLLRSLRRDDLLLRLDAFERERADAGPGDAELRAACDLVCEHVGREWRRLARQLHLPETRIEAAEEKHPRELREQVREALRAWRDARGEAASVDELLAALRGCGLNLVADLVEEARPGPPGAPETP